MNDPQLAAALRSSSPDALPELLDAYGDRLFSYCWSLLRNRENAQIAVRDALVVATAQIERLVCDEWLVLWLYSLARAECLRREAVPPADADEPIARPNADDADSRLMAWKAVTGMPANEVEALELDARHDVDLRLVLGLGAAEAEGLLDRARRDLERALAAEILVRKSNACPACSGIVTTGWTGTTTPALRDRVLDHAAACAVCGPNLPRSVSAARVFALLPAPALSSVARLEILGFFEDARMAAYREFTVSRAEETDGSWFLNGPDSAADRELPDSWFTPAPKPLHLAPVATPDLFEPWPAAPDPAAPDPAAAEPVLSVVPDLPAPPASLTSAPSPVPAAAASVSEAATGPIGTGPIGTGPMVAQGFMGSWLTPTEPATPAVPAEPAALAVPPSGLPGLGAPPRPTVPRPRSAPAPARSHPAPAPTASRPNIPAPQPPAPQPPAPQPPAPQPPAPQPPAPQPPAATTAPAPEPLAPVIPLSAPPNAAPAPPRTSRPAAPPAKATHPARRRPRVSRVGVAAAASVLVTAVFALAGGFHMKPSATNSANPPAAASQQPGAATAQQPGGGADAALPVKVKRSSGASATTEPIQQSATTKSESLALAAAPQPGTASASVPGLPGAPKSASSSSASSSSTSSATGNLVVTPGQLNLGNGTTGQITLTAKGGPVSWSADTSSSLVVLNDQQGSLRAGQSVTLTVTVTQNGDSGDEFVFVDSWPSTGAAAGAPSAGPSATQAVEVTWTSPRSVTPSPSPSASDSSSPSPSASPSTSSPAGSPSSD